MVQIFTNQHNMYKAARPMKTEVLEHAVILPQLDCGEYPRWGLGGVCDRNNAFVDLSFYDGGWATHGGKYAWDTEEYQDCTAVYFGVFFPHWGHFLVDLIGRLWYFAKHNKDRNVKIAYLGENEPTGNFLEFFELMGIAKEQLVHITTPTRFRKVIVPEYSCKSCVWYTEEYQQIFDTITQRVESEEKPFQEVPEKIYFSRLAFAKAKDTEFGEQHLADWLHENGYQSISPEQLSLREQVYLWNHAGHIACLDGTIPLNVSFCRNNDLHLLVMHKTHLEHLNLELALLMRPCHCVLLDAYYEPFKKYPTSIGAGPFLLCISDDVIDYSKQQAMIMPFSSVELKLQLVVNYCRLVLRIINLGGRIRAFISKLLPERIKSTIRTAISSVRKNQVSE